MSHHFISPFSGWSMEACEGHFEEVWSETLFRIIARLHEHISDGGTGAPPALSPTEKVHRLEAIIYTAQAAITSLDVRYPEREANDTRHHGLS